MIEKTFVLFKPDAVERQIVGDILSRFERVGLKIVGMKMQQIDEEFAKKHYKNNVGKHFYPRLEKFIVSGPVIALVLEGVMAVDLVRKLVGSTEPASALPGTIRGDYSHHHMDYADARDISVKNVIHASGNREEAKEEISLWFSEDELINYETVHEKHTH